MDEPLQKSALDCGDGSDDNKRNSSKENIESSPDEDKPEHLSSNNLEKDSSSVLGNGGGSPVFVGEDGPSIVKLNSESNRKYSNLATNTNHVQGNKEVSSNDRSCKGTKNSSEAAVNSLDDLSNDFGNTFMLDEELELEHGTIKKDDRLSVRRYYFLFVDFYYFTLCSMSMSS